MKLIVDVNSLKALSFSDYKKALKKDKRFLNKVQAALFIVDNPFQDKKGLAIVLYRKEKEAKLAFKEFWFLPTGRGQRRCKMGSELAIG